MREIAQAAGVSPGELSRIENGIAVPRDKDVQALEAAYGALITDWYPPRVLLALEVEDDAAIALEARMRRPLLQSG